MTAYQSSDPSDATNVGKRLNGAVWVRRIAIVFNRSDGADWIVWAEVDYSNDPLVSGGRHKHTSQTWFAQGPPEHLRKTSFQVVYFGETGLALLHTGLFKDEAAHIYDNSIPRVTYPNNVKNVGIQVEAYAVNGAIIHFGMDITETPTLAPQDIINEPGHPDQNLRQAMISPSFHADDGEPGSTGIYISFTMWAPASVVLDPEWNPAEREYKIVGDEITYKKTF